MLKKQQHHENYICHSISLAIVAVTQYDIEYRLFSVEINQPSTLHYLVLSIIELCLKRAFLHISFIEA